MDGEVTMQKLVYGMTVVTPIDFPDEIGIDVVEFDPQTERTTGIVFTLKSRSWEWIKNNYAISKPAYFEECEDYLKDGHKANLVRGEFPIDIQE
jgi:hypothetical protein